MQSLKPAGLPPESRRISPMKAIISSGVENALCEAGEMQSSFMATPPASSAQLAAEWGPYILACIEAFGAERCMFESNFPVDRCSGSYVTLWNAFKRIVAGASADERTALFSGTATKVYRPVL